LKEKAEYPTIDPSGMYYFVDDVLTYIGFPATMNMSLTPNKADFILRQNGIVKTISSVAWSTPTSFRIAAGSLSGTLDLSYTRGAVLMTTADGGRTCPSFIEQPVVIET
jgi:hypothetical protein